MSEGVRQLKDEGTQSQVIVAGASAGLVSRFVIAPLDVLKIRLQLYHSLADPLYRPPKHAPYKGTVSTFKQILKHEGITGFWKGNIPAELLYVAYGSIQFLSYRQTSALLSNLSVPRPNNASRSSRGVATRSDASAPDETRLKLPPTAVNFASGAFAGVLATTSTYPLDLLRTRFAAQDTDRIYSSLAYSIRQIRRTEGPRGFFRGLTAAVSQIVPYMGLFFASYEALKPVCNTLPHFPLLGFGSGDALAGIVASVFSKTAVFPLDTVRKRLQVQGPQRARFGGGRVPLYEGGVVKTVVQVVRREGLKSLYRGLPVSLVKAAPASAVTMWTYERTMGVMLRWDEAVADD